MSTKPIHSRSPVQDIREHVSRAQGVKSQYATDRELAQLKKLVLPDIIYFPRSYQFYRANIGASGDAAYLSRVAAPSSDAAWAMLNLPLITPAGGFIVGLDLWSSEARTAGTATMRVRVTESGTSTDYDFPDCELNATYTQTASSLHWRGSPKFAAGATLEPRIVTASWTPTTADVGIILNVVYELGKPG